MLHNQTWTESLGKFLARAGRGIFDLFRLDMTETKWGHRVMDQIFREGKFSPNETHDSNQKGSNP